MNFDKRELAALTAAIAGQIYPTLDKNNEIEVNARIAASEALEVIMASESMIEQFWDDVISVAQTRTPAPGE